MTQFLELVPRCIQVHLPLERQHTNFQLKKICKEQRPLRCFQVCSTATCLGCILVRIAPPCTDFYDFVCFLFPSFYAVLLATLILLPVYFLLFYDKSGWVAVPHVAFMLVMSTQGPLHHHRRCHLCKFFARVRIFTARKCTHISTRCNNRNVYGSLHGLRYIYIIYNST